jgi:hypothetical protein
MGSTDMIVSIVIIAISLTLFVYWFRYTCLLILSARTTKDYAPHVASANQLRFLEIREKLLSSPTPEDLDTLNASLQRDYQLLTYLMKYAAGRQRSAHGLENRILMIDYHIMIFWYAIVRRVSSTQARQALLEMSSIVQYLANAMGERLSFSASASSRF